MSRMQREAGTVGIVCVLLVVSIVALVLMIPAGPGPRSALADDPSPPPLTERELALCLHAVSLDPESLAAAGVSDPGVAAVVAAGASYISGSGVDMAGVRRRANAARSDLERTESQARSGHVTQEVLEAARDQDEEVSAHLAQLMNGLFTTAVAPLPSGQRAVLTTIRANSAMNSLPKAWLAVNRSQSDWIAIRDALACQDIAQRSGESTPADAAAIIVSASDQVTVGALASVDSNLPGARSAFDSTVAALGE